MKASNFIFFVLLFISFSGILSAQAEREVIVYIKPGYIDFPDSTDQAFSMLNAGILSTELNDVFNHFNVVQISRTFPSFYKNDTLITTAEAGILNVAHFSRIYTILLSSEYDVEEFIEELSGMNEIVFAEPNISDAELGSDPDYYRQWYLKNTGQFGTPGADIKIEPVWSIVTGGNTNKISIMDCGVELTHRDLSGRISGDVNLGSHGTFIAGIIGAKANNQYDIKGINWNTQMYSFRIFENGTIIPHQQVVNKLLSATVGRVINNSWGSAEYFALIRLAFQYLTINGYINVASMMNNSSVQSYYPAGFNGVIAVGATDNNGNRPGYSNYGSHIDLVAPGGASGEFQTTDRIFSTTIGNTTTYNHGTSMSAAMVTGVISLLINYKSLEREDVEGLIKVSANDIGQSGWDQYTGYGGLNAERAIAYNRSPYSITKYPVSGTVSGGEAYGSPVTLSYQVSVSGLGIVGSSLPDGVYYLKRIEVRKTVNFSVPGWHSVIGAWGRSSVGGVRITGWATDFGIYPTSRLFSPTFFCEVVPGTLTNNSVTLRTYIYQFYNQHPAYYPNSYIGTYPASSPSNVQNWQFSLLTKNNKIRFYEAADVISGNNEIILENDNIASEHTNDFFVRDSARIVLLDSAVLELPDNYTLHLSGRTTSLTMNPHSKIKFGENSKIVLDSSASIVANNAEFVSVDSTHSWSGINISNADQIEINNSTFRNFSTAISIINHVTDGENFIQLKNNQFHISESQGKGIYAENAKNILIQDNGFNFTNSTNTYGVLIKNNVGAGEGEAAGQIEIDPGLGGPFVTLLRNTFNNGSFLPVFLGSYSSELMKLVFLDNKIYNTNGYGFGGRMLGGNIKNNIFSTTSINPSLVLWQSHVNLFNNEITNNSASTDAITSVLNQSFPRMAPVRDNNGEIIWFGGKNKITSAGGDNIRTNYCIPYTDYGNNSFTTDNVNSFHIYGSVPDSIVLKYFARDNCWYGNNPKVYLYHTETPNSPLWINSGLNVLCPYVANYTNMDVTEAGNGYYDTLFYSEDDIPEPPEDDEILFSQAAIKYHESSYTGAINDYKSLLDNYSNSDYRYAAVSQLGECYFALDTTIDQAIKDILFSDLKNYLILKLTQYDGDGDFEDIAYNLIVLCNIELKDYNPALDAYEFIALYHPDAAVRLNASYDYSALEDLIESSSGGAVSSKFENMTTETFFKIKAREFGEKLKDDPILRKMKKNYDRKSPVVWNEKKDDDKKDVIDKNTKSLGSGQEKNINKEIERRLQTRAMENLMQLRYLNTAEKERKFSEDLSLMYQMLSGSGNENNSEIIPEKFELFQNYPNPFNPVTKIKFSLPMEGKVKLVIYDILGKEIIKLIDDEITQQGTQIVEFNGINLASGAYFYRLEVNGQKKYVETKKMMLIK